jgi:hypothetical protein
MKTKTILLTSVLMMMIAAGCAMPPQQSVNTQRTQAPVSSQDVNEQEGTFGSGSY